MEINWRLERMEIGRAKHQHAAINMIERLTGQQMVDIEDDDEVEETVRLDFIKSDGHDFETMTFCLPIEEAKMYMIGHEYKFKDAD